jgi:pimeloyl-ACP methyl ester carboxylesterase
MSNRNGLNGSSEGARQTAEAGELAPMVAIGGLLTIKQVDWWYSKLLSQDTSSKVPAKERFIAPPYRGIAHPDKIRAKLTDHLERLQERLDGKRMYIVGHSLGGLLATETALERPDLVAGVSSLGGAHAGIRRHTIASRALQYGLGNPKEAQLLKHDSGFMQEHMARMATEWPKDTPLHIASTALDVIIPPPQGFDVQLPDGQEPSKSLIMPDDPFTAHLLRLMMRVPDDVQTIESSYLTEHVNLPRSPVVIADVEAHRRAASGYSFDPLMAAVTGPMRAESLVAA